MRRVLAATLTTLLGTAVASVAWSQAPEAGGEGASEAAREAPSEPARETPPAAAESAAPSTPAPGSALRTPAGDGIKVAVTESLVVKVADKEGAIERLTAAATQAGGYFTTRTEKQIIFKLPPAAMGNMVALAEKEGTVVARDYTATDVGRSLEEKKTLLASRQSVLDRYFSVLAGADVSSVVTVEREMTQLVQEIESLKGAIRLLEHQLSFAQLAVAFEFRDRRPPARDGSSSFPWLNTVNLADLHAEFAHETF